MRPTQLLLQHRQPMIRFLGKRKTPTNVDHAPKAHPVSPTHSLPESFASYRQSALQHGPLGGNRNTATQTEPSPSSTPPSAPARSTGRGLGGRSGKSLGSVKPAAGQYFDRSELPKRYQRTGWSLEEIEAVDSGGASLR